MDKERKIPVNVVLPISFIDNVDANRGRISRSEILRDFLLKNFESIILTPLN